MESHTDDSVTVQPGRRLPARLFKKCAVRVVSTVDEEVTIVFNFNTTAIMKIA